MRIYNITYNTNPLSTDSNQINIKVIPCDETYNSFCWDGRRLSKREVNIIHTNVYNNSLVSLRVYATSLDILDTFKKQVQLALTKCLNTIDNNYEQSTKNCEIFRSENGDQKIDIKEAFQETVIWEDSPFQNDDFYI